MLRNYLSNMVKILSMHLCASQWHKTLSYKDDFFKDGMTYDADFTKAFGYAPPYQAAESSAALLVFKDAFERANSFDKEKLEMLLLLLICKLFMET